MAEEHLTAQSAWAPVANCARQMKAESRDEHCKMTNSIIALLFSLANEQKYQPEALVQKYFCDQNPNICPVFKYNISWPEC